MTPTVLISIESTVAASGVPNSAEKAALMPHMMVRRRSSFRKCSSCPSPCPSEPPTCSAAPSRPAEPPKRCVSTVDTMMSGAIFTGTRSLSRMASSTRFVPRGFRAPRR